MSMTITVQNRIARVTGTPEIICGNSGYMIAFTFDTEWNEYVQKTAQFRYFRDGKAVTEAVDFSGSFCAVPVLRDVDFVEIGVTAGDIRTASPARIPCIRCITDIPSSAYKWPRDVYNELMERLRQAYHPPKEPKFWYIVTAEGDYVVTSDGAFVVAKE